MGRKDLMKVAIVYDYLISYGGGERVLEAICQIYPKSTVYTLLYDAKRTGFAFVGKKIKTSFLQKIPGSKRWHRYFIFLMPLAIEQFDFSKYDVVISVSSSFAKGIITPPNCVHINYCLTPTRYLWDSFGGHMGKFEQSFILKRIIFSLLTYLRIWDIAASKRADIHIAISKFVAGRIKKYYGFDCAVIYPPVETDKFNISNEPKNYFLMVGRLVAYKKFDLAISAFNQLGLPLKIIGTGPEEGQLKKIAEKNIEFLGPISDKKLAEIYANAKAVIFPQVEDFGIVPLESMACGVPVIAYRAGGVLETIKKKISGIFFEKQTVDDLKDAVMKFEKLKFNSQEIKSYVEQFDKKEFGRKMKAYINRYLNDQDKQL